MKYYDNMRLKQAMLINYELIWKEIESKILTVIIQVRHSSDFDFSTTENWILLINYATLA